MYDVHAQFSYEKLNFKFGLKYTFSYFIVRFKNIICEDLKLLHTLLIINLTIHTMLFPKYLD